MKHGYHYDYGCDYGYHDGDDQDDSDGQDDADGQDDPGDGGDESHYRNHRNSSQVKPRILKVTDRALQPLP